MSLTYEVAQSVFLPGGMNGLNDPGHWGVLERKGAHIKTARPADGPFEAISSGLSVLAAGHFQQVITKLGFHWALHDVDWRAEHDSVEFLDHLAWTERAQIAALTAGRAARVGFGDFGEISASFDLGFQFVALFFAGNKDVAGSGFSHGNVLLSKKGRAYRIKEGISRESSFQCPGGQLCFGCFINLRF
jgi:hypothetical protein